MKVDPIKVDEQGKEIAVDPNRKICIVGSAGTTVEQTPWKDTSFEIWALAWRRHPRVERLFDMHKPGASDRVPEDYLTRLASQAPIPIIMQNKHPLVPNSIKYPIEEMIDYFGPQLDPYADGDYFTSSISYMLALAIYENPKEIHLYGIDLITDSEYAYQKPNTEYLIGISRGKGIPVYIPRASAIGKFPYRYGYEDPPKPLLSQEVMADRVKQYRNKHNKALADMYTSDGALQEATQLLNILKMLERDTKDGTEITDIIKTKLEQLELVEARGYLGEAAISERSDPADGSAIDASANERGEENGGNGTD